MGGGRNSSIELLRIVAMFMILASHFVVHNGYDVKDLPVGPMRIFFQLVMQSGGVVGVVIFFTISAWFFLDKEQTIKSNLKRIWILEREVLFWSLVPLAFFLVFDRTALGMKLIVRSVAPTTMGLWWYVTAYAAFLALLPFLSKGLRALGKRNHLILVAIVLVIWGLTSFIPGAVGLNGYQDGVFGFIYLFILISAYKWYMKPFTLKQIWLMTGIGFGFFVVYTCASIALALLGINKGIFINAHWKLPVIMVGFGMFLLFDRLSFHSRIVNRVARSAFAVYLITEYPPVRDILWKCLDLRNFLDQPFAIWQISGILLVVYIVCTLIDFVRQWLFSLTVDRNRGHWFELVWSKTAERIRHIKSAQSSAKA